MLITKHNTILNVTKGAYNSIFEHEGWTAYSGEPPKKDFSEEVFMHADSVEETTQQKLVQSELPFGNMSSSDTSFEEEMEEDEDYTVVLEDMSIKQLVEYADEQNIALEEGMKKATIIATIKEAMGW